MKIMENILESLLKQIKEYVLENKKNLLRWYNLIITYLTSSLCCISWGLIFLLINLGAFSFINF